VHKLDYKLFDIFDARCNHEVYIGAILTHRLLDLHCVSGTDSVPVLGLTISKTNVTKWWVFTL